MSLDSLLANRWLRLGAFAVAVVVLFFLPLYATPFQNQTITRIGVFAVAILGLNIVMGFAGQVSLGHVLFLGLGAYASNVTVRASWSQDLGWFRVVIALALSIVIATVVGWLVALAAARVRGLGLALVTIALPIVAVPIAKRLSSITGGSEGQSALFIPQKSGGLYQDQIQYYIVIGVGLVFLVLAYFLVRGKYGRAFTVVKANEAVAASMGISPYRFKVMAFTIASLLGGVAGFLHLVANQYTSPDVMNFSNSITLVISSIVGGAGTIVGAILGGAFYVLLPQWTNSIHPGSLAVMQGAAVLLILFLLPGGLATLPRALRRAFSHVWRRKP